jgi:biopolymer transport protein ExbB
MFELIKSGGIMMFPLIFSSIIALAIIIERFLALRLHKVVPPNDIELARKMAGSAKLSETQIDELRNSSLIGRVLATGLESRELPRHIMKENVEEAGRHAVHELEHYLPALGTIATAAPLMGLLGTVLGMIAAFSTITKIGVGNPTELSSAIAEALVSTAIGLFVAIPALMFHRYFRARVDHFVVRMEQEAMRLVEITNNQRRTTPAPPVTPTANASASSAAAAAAATRRPPLTPAQQAAIAAARNGRTS